MQHGFERGFDRFLEGYRDVLGTLLNHRKVFVLVFLAFCAASLCLIPFLGRDFFPTVDAGAFRLHVRAQTGTRIEETAKLVDEVEKTIREVIPAARAEGHPRQYRPARFRHQSELQRQRLHRPGGRGHHGLAQ